MSETEILIWLPSQKKHFHHFKSFPCIAKWQMHWNRISGLKRLKFQLISVFPWGGSTEGKQSQYIFSHRNLCSYLQSSPTSGHKADWESLELPSLYERVTDQRHEENLQSTPWPSDFKSLCFQKFKTFI